jgi:hypothetical protein
MRLTTTLLFCSAWLAIPAAALPASLQERTIQAFERYMQGAQARVDERLQGRKSFLWADESPQRREQVRHGEVAVEPLVNRGDTEVPGGLIHDWIGAVFVPGATLHQTLALVQDYDRHSQIYRPEVIASKTLSRDGNRFRIHLRLLKKKVITVVLNTEHEVEYFPLEGRRCHSRSHTTRIAEVDNPGEPGERELAPGAGHGFLWRLNTYWRFAERDGGVWIECQAVSLTRNVPTGLGWLIEPIIRGLPRESLANTLRATRAAVK